jgi:hypothetical protein
MVVSVSADQVNRTSPISRMMLSYCRRGASRRSCFSFKEGAGAEAEVDEYGVKLVVDSEELVGDMMEKGQDWGLDQRSWSLGAT